MGNHKNKDPDEMQLVIVCTIYYHKSDIQQYCSQRFYLHPLELNNRRSQCAFPRSIHDGAVTHRIKITDAERSEKNAKNVYPVMEVISVAVNVDAEVVRSGYVPNKQRKRKGQLT